MCGLAGVYSTNFNAWEYDAFHKLLFLNVFRGGDSTGIIRGETTGRIMARKTLLPSPEFLNDPSSDIVSDAKGFNKPWVLMGHTRAATKGAVILKNAHPFGFKNVVGMHNGTIHTGFKHRKEYDTDSEAFYRNLNDYGLQAALEEIEAHDTAYAFQWIDKKDKTLNFIKNDKRPLHFTYAFGGTTLLWSSDMNDLKYVLRNKRYDTHEGWDRSRTEKFFTLDANYHLRLKLGAHPDEEIELTKLDIKKKYQTFSTTTMGGGTPAGVSKTGKPNTNGVWLETTAGWRYVHTEGTTSPLALPPPRTQASTNSSKSPSQTSTQTGGTSGTTPSTQRTSTGTPDRKETPDRERSFRDEYGATRLKTLDWLKEGVNADDPGLLGLSEPNLDQSSLLDRLFDTDHAAANNPDGVQPTKKSNVVPFKGGKADDVGSIRGFQGQMITDAEFRHHLNQGCFCCSQPLSLDNPHDFAQINNIHWWERDLWACDYCYNTSEGDWVRRSIEDDWADFDSNKTGDASA